MRVLDVRARPSLNYQLRKIIKNRGHFPNDDAAIKLLWLAICVGHEPHRRPDQVH